MLAGTVAAVVHPRAQEWYLLLADQAEADEFFVTHEQVLADVLAPAEERRRAQALRDLCVVQVAGGLVAEVFQQVVLISFLIDGRGVKEHRPAVRPRDSLRHEA